jgi:GMP synthase-like glutamine amidotransferase
MKILIVQNSFGDPPGLVGDRTLARGGAYHVYHPAERYLAHTPLSPTDLPSECGDYDGLAILGGGMNADDDEHYPHFAVLFRLIESFEAAGRPVLGLCLGAQLLARRYGKPIRRMDHFELGLTEIRILPAADSDPLLQGLGPTQRVMQWHHDTFDLPAEATLLASSRACPYQIFRVGPATYACQGHPEVSQDVIRKWVYDGRTYLGDQIQELTDVAAGVDEHWTAARAFSTTFIDRWLDLAAARS